MKETSPKSASYRFFDLVVGIFVTVLIVSNVASSAKIVDWGREVFGIRLAFDAGTLLFPISYIFGDILTEVYGYRRSRRVIWTGFICLAFSSLVFAIVGVLPGEADWKSRVGQGAYDAVIGGMSTGGIVIASLLAYWAGEFSNSVTLAKLKIRTQGRWLWMRTIGSTLIGEGVDTLVFVGVATLLGVFSREIFVSLVIANYFFKCAIEVVMTPVTYLIVNGLKKVEHEDTYDIGTNFNPFRA